MVVRHCLALGALGLIPSPCPTAQRSGRVPLAPQAAEAHDVGWAALVPTLPGQLCVRGTLAGLEVVMQLDSGSGMTVVDRLVARRLGLRGPSDAGNAADATDGPRLAESLEVVIGGTRFTLARALELDIAGAHDDPGHAPVILGREVFERFVVDLDLPGRRVALRELDGFTYSGAGLTLTLLRGDLDDLLVEAGVEDLPVSRFRLDTGMRMLELSPAYTRQHGLLRERAPVSQLPYGDGALARVATLRSFTFAGQRFADVPAAFPAEGSALTEDGPGAGSIGADVLARFRAIIDLSRGRLHLEPAPDQASLPFPRNRLGLAFAVHDDAFEVTFVAPGSPAAAADIAPGARIVAWNGQPAGPASRAAFARCLESPAGVEVTLTGGAGDVRTLVARDYY